MRITRDVRLIVKHALREDVGREDITTLFTIPVHYKTKAVVLAKEDGVLCGIDVMRAVFKERDLKVNFKALKKDGQRFRFGEHIAYATGPARSILAAERVGLNFLSKLSGIATITSRFVAKLEGSRARLLDTRKTTPTLRVLEKYAVRCGGGYNHRSALEEAILVKDNHLRAGRFIVGEQLNRELLAKGLAYLRKIPQVKIEIEVETLPEFEAVIKHQPDVVMLDNLKVEDMHEAVAYRDKNFPKVKLEASGGVTLDNVEAIGRTGVDFISTGYVTHSAKAIDFSLEIM